MTNVKLLIAEIISCLYQYFYHRNTGVHPDLKPREQSRGLDPRRHIKRPFSIWVWQTHPHTINWQCASFPFIRSASAIPADSINHTNAMGQHIICNSVTQWLCTTPVVFCILYSSFQNKHNTVDFCSSPLHLTWTNTHLIVWSLMLMNLTIYCCVGSTYLWKTWDLSKQIIFHTLSTMISWLFNGCINNKVP